MILLSTWYFSDACATVDNTTVDRLFFVSSAAWPWLADPAEAPAPILLARTSVGTVRGILELR